MLWKNVHREVLIWAAGLNIIICFVNVAVEYYNEKGGIPGEISM